jgi:alpha 1,6-mannosyltransferase
MLTIRKLAFLVAGIFFIFIFILKLPPPQPSIIRKGPYRLAIQNPSNTKIDKPSSARKTKEEIEQILDQENRPLRTADEFSSLREHLEYLFPYQGASGTKFPAYIWQTWKYTPAMGEFDLRFRMTEASWTEKHPDYVHEVRNTLQFCGRIDECR